MHAYPHIQLLIHGQWRDSAQTREVINPATEQVVGTVPVAAPQDIDDALASAQRGLQVWRATSVGERTAVLLRAAQLLRERAETIATATVLEQGKPLAAAKFEVLRAAGILEWDANEGARHYGRTIDVAAGMHCEVRKEPIGVVAGFAPWNAPVGSPMRKVAASLASGCALILKPAEETPAGAFYIAQALVDAGLPAGVLNVLYGNPTELSQRLISAPEVRLVTFTGSIAVGRALTQLAAQHLKPSLMELGGHAPVIVCSDVDAAQVAAEAVKAKANNAGQICVSPTRFLVHAEVFETFSRTFAQLAQAIAVGDGFAPGTVMGPLSNARRVADVDALVQDAIAHGAQVLAGGQRPKGPGYFYPLTVLANVPLTARVMHEEPFGPVAILNSFTDVEAAIAEANRLPVGLAAYAYSRSFAMVERLSSEIQVGSLAINTFQVSAAQTPFGGVKDSGFGREGGAESLDAYTCIKSVMKAVH